MNMNFEPSSAPNWRQSIVMLGAGTLLAGSACWGFLNESDKGHESFLLGGGFVAGMMLVLAGAVSVVIQALRRPAGDVAAGRVLDARPAWPQALVILGSGALLAASSCFGFFESLSWKNSLYGLFATGFYSGVVVTTAGLVLLLVRVAKVVLIRARR